MIVVIIIAIFIFLNFLKYEDSKAKEHDRYLAIFKEIEDEMSQQK